MDKDTNLKPGFWRKTSLWLKDKWLWICLGAVIIVGFFVFRFSPKTNTLLIKKYKEAIARNQEEIRRLEELNKKQKLEEEELRRIYERKISEVQQQYRKIFDNIEEDRKKEVLDIIEETNGDPDEMARKLNKFFGIVIFDEKDENKNNNNSSS